MGGSNAPAKLLDLLKKKPSETKTKRVDMLISSKVTRLEVHFPYTSYWEAGIMRA